MEPIKIEDVVKLQREFAARVRQRVAAAAKVERARPERFIGDLEDRLSELRAELDAAVAARDAAARRYDEEIARKREAAETLERELDEARKALKAEEKQAASKNAADEAALPKGRARSRKTDKGGGTEQPGRE